MKPGFMLIIGNNPLFHVQRLVLLTHGSRMCKKGSPWMGHALMSNAFLEGRLWALPCIWSSMERGRSAFLLPNIFPLKSPPALSTRHSYPHTPVKETRVLSFSAEPRWEPGCSQPCPCCFRHIPQEKCEHASEPKWDQVSSLQLAAQPGAENTVIKNLGLFGASSRSLCGVSVKAGPSSPLYVSILLSCFLLKW